MKIRFPLYAQMLLFLLLHLVIIGTVFFVFFNTQFGTGWEALIRSPAGDRVEEIAWLLEHQMEHETATEKENTLQRFGKIYGVTFYIFDGMGRQLGGPKITLPSKVLAHIRRLHRFEWCTILMFRRSDNMLRQASDSPIVVRKIPQSRPLRR